MIDFSYAGISEYWKYLEGDIEETKEMFWENDKGEQIPYIREHLLTLDEKKKWNVFLHKYRKQVQIWINIEVPLEQDKLALEMADEEVKASGWSLDTAMAFGVSSTKICFLERIKKADFNREQAIKNAVTKMIDIFDLYSCLTILSFVFKPLPEVIEKYPQLKNYQK